MKSEGIEEYERKHNADIIRQSMREREREAKQGK